VAKLQPKDPEPHLSAGFLLEKQGQPEQAEQEYKTGVGAGQQVGGCYHRINQSLHARQALS